MAAAQQLKRALVLHHCLVDPSRLPRDSGGGFAAVTEAELAVAGSTLNLLIPSFLSQCLSK